MSRESKMAQPAWKRPGSPIGKRGARKAHPKYKQRAGQPWSSKEVKELRTLARDNTPTGVLSVKLRRPPAAIRSKAQREGISLKPTNRSPYNRRERTLQLGVAWASCNRRLQRARSLVGIFFHRRLLHLF